MESRFCNIYLLSTRQSTCAQSVGSSSKNFLVDDAELLVDDADYIGQALGERLKMACKV